MTVHYLGRCGATSLFFHQYLRLKKRTYVVDALVGDSYLDGFGAFVAG